MKNPNMTKININIDNSCIIQDDYIGFGVNNWSSDLSQEGKNKLGMTEAHFLLNAKRIETVRPAMVRIMVMPHYLMFLDDPDKGESKWNSGELNFESSYIQSFFKHAFVYKKSGTEIMLNWGGAVAEEVTDWYGITGVEDGSAGTRSAPNNLEAFAKNLRIFLEECFKRGVTNITSLNFHNEISYLNYSTYGDKRIYWVKMLEYCHKELKQAGIRDKVTIMGVDIATNHGFHGEFGLETNPPLHAEAFKYIYDNAKDSKTGEKYYDAMSAHIYLRHDREVWNLEKLKQMTDNMYKYYGNVWMTEFATYSSDSKPEYFSNCSDRFKWFTSNSFEVSRAAQMWVHANSGFPVSLHWYFYGGYIPAPIYNYQYTDEKKYLYYNMWNCPSDKAHLGGAERVSTTFGELGLLMRYIPKHSKVLKSCVDSTDAHITAFSTSDNKDVSIVVEVNKGYNKEILLNLGEYSNNLFRRHIYEYPDDINSEKAVNQYDANALLPVGIPIKVKDGKIRDFIGDGHYLIVYTTLPEAQQVYFKNPEKVASSVKNGESIALTPIETFGLNGDCSVKYSIIYGKGTIADNGLYTADNGTKPGDIIAVKVQSDSKNALEEAYAIALIEIK